MTRKRMLAAGAAVALTLGLGAGVAAAQTDDDEPSRSETATCPHGDMDRGDMDAMHDQMRASMPEDMQAQCDTIHTQGGSMSGGMMNGPMGSES